VKRTFRVETCNIVYFYVFFININNYAVLQQKYEAVVSRKIDIHCRLIRQRITCKNDNNDDIQ